MRLTKLASIGLLSICLPAPTLMAAPINKLSFSPEYGVFAELIVDEQDVKVKVKRGSVVVARNIHIETGKSLKIHLEDFNFDGLMDFAVSHLDEGMGVYAIYQIYVYSHKSMRFEQIFPKCGDDFINVVVLRREKILKNSYFSGNEIKTCAMAY